MSTFHQFSLLPIELRLRIWEAAVTTRYIRIVEIPPDTYPERKGPRFRYVLDPNLPSPALMHTCHESRNLGLYQKAFYSEERYHWVSFDTDVFQIKFRHIRELAAPETALIKHMRVEVKVDGSGNEDEEWHYYIQRYVVNNYLDIRTFEFLVDEDMMRWTSILRDGGAGGKCHDPDFRVIDVRMGEWISRENWWKYSDWWEIQVDEGPYGGESTRDVDFPPGSPPLYTSEKVQPELEADPDTIATCTAWYDNGGLHSCERVRESLGVSPETFSRWNPSITLDFDNWQIGWSYCTWVEEEAPEAPSSSTTSTTAATTTTAEPRESPTGWEDLGCWVYSKDDLVTLDRAYTPAGGDPAMTQDKCRDI